MLAAALAAGALTFAAMGMVVGMGMIVQMVVVMGVYMVMLMGVLMRMGMGNTVMGVLVGVFMGMRMLVLRSTAGNVIFVDVHCNSSFGFFPIILVCHDSVKVFIFREISPGGACQKGKSRV